MPLSPQRTEGDSLEAYLHSIRATHEQLDSGISWSGHERNCAYLNTGKDGHFANLSALSGLDFLDDARGMAFVDWDHDGDLDLWLSNRTNPRLRLMRNRSVNNRQYLAIRLEGNGKSTNRDAIGARVDVKLDNGTVVSRSLRAGEGFLSQSSKWLHFGLGSAEVNGVTVRWPAGRTEVFDGLGAGGHYRLAQGTGTGTRWGRPGAVANALRPLPVPDPATTDSARLVLSSRLPMPTLTLREFDSPDKEKEVSFGKRATLVNLWASWCAPCQVELGAFRKHAKAIADAGIDIVALSTDGLADNEATTISDARKASAKLDLPFLTASATSETLSKMERMRRFLFDRRLPFSLPASYLIDSKGRLAAIYRGPVSVSTLFADFKNLGQSPEERRGASVPFVGRWYTLPSEVNPRALAKWFEESFPDEATTLLNDQIRRQTARIETSKLSTAESDRARFEIVESHRLLGTIQMRLGSHKEAAESYRAGLAFEPEDPHLRYLRTSALKAAGLTRELKAQLQSWLKENPADYQTRLRLAEVHLDEKEFSSAALELSRASTQEPDDVYGQFLLGLALAQTGSVAEAATQFGKVLSLQSDHREALLNLAAASEQLGKVIKAVELYHKAFELTPESPFVTYKLAQLHASLGEHEKAIRFYDRTITIRPDTARLYEEAASSLLAAKRHKKAASRFMEAFQKDPRRVGAANNAAWILATHPSAPVRDAYLAHQLAEKINTLTNYQNASLLDTLAVAYANKGQFQKALDTARKALAIAEKEDNPTAEGIRKRLELFKKSKPFRDR